MRQHHYNFAHRVLPNDVASNPALWNLISGDKAHSYLQVRWQDSALDAEPQPPKGLIWIEPVKILGAEIRVIRMPPAQAMSEVHYSAIMKCADGSVRYFVAEQGESSVYYAEWRGTMRIRGAALEESLPLDAMQLINATPSDAAPWEVSKTAIAGMPYLASFIMSIAFEHAASNPNAAANDVHKNAGGKTTLAQLRGPLILLGIALAVIIAIVLSSAAN